MKTIQEQIAVMQHYAGGGEVECKNQEGNNWGRIQYPSWDWACFDYRIKQPVDPYAELKAAAIDPTKQIRCGGCDWHDAGYHWSFSDTPETYEIRDKPDPYAELKAAAADPTKQIRCLADGYPRWFSGHAWLKSDGTYDFVLLPSHYEIRDKPRTVKLLAWFDSHRLVLLLESAIPADYWKRVPSEDKTVEVEP